MRRMKFALALFAGGFAMAQVKVPRPAPEFEIVEASGRMAELSRLSRRCRSVSVRGHELFALPGCIEGVRKAEERVRVGGLRVTAVVFDDNADIAGCVKKLGLTFPVGRGNRTDVRTFLGIGQSVRIGTPQVVLIDRIGMIRAQSAQEGSPMLQSAEILEGLIDTLLRRNAVL